jgi:hybrid cluster-associated redox disulfide protein
MMPSAIESDMPVDEIMRRWPATIRVMIRHRMLCIGCPIGIFHTVADAAAAHTIIDEASFSAELLAAMRSDPSTEILSAFGVKVPEPGNQEGEVSCARSKS